MSEDQEVLMARGLRLSIIKGFFESGALSKDDALELLNAPLVPDDPDAQVYDDRDKIDWTIKQVTDWLTGNGEKNERKLENKLD